MVKNNALTPPKIAPGDTIGIITPASPMEGGRLERGCVYLRDLGYEVVLGESVFKTRGYLAGSDDQRAADLNAMFSDPQIDAIFCSRGGYGTPRLLDLVDYDNIREHPKVFVGYSDLTTLQLAIWHKTGLITFSGPMVAVEMGGHIEPFTAAQLWRTLCNARVIGGLAHPPEAQPRALVPGEARGRLLGGCLSTMLSLLGSPYAPDFSGSILVLEDIGEEPYRIDRYFAHLRAAGILKSVNGLILGTFLDCEPSDPSKPSLSVAEVLNDYTAHLGIPVLTGFAYGHGEIKFTLPIGAEVTLDAGPGEVTLTEPVVSE